MKPLLNALALCGLLLLAPAAARAQPAAGDDSVSVAQIMFARINEARRDSGLPPYRENATLTRIAFAHAQEIAAHNHYSHTSLDGRRAKDRAVAAGYGAGHAGLRIGENFVGRKHLDDGFQWLMEDPPHRANMLHPEYREAGSGAARMSYGYVWVIDFGTYNGIDSALAAGGAAAAPAPATPTTGATAAPQATATRPTVAASPVAAAPTDAATPLAGSTPSGTSIQPVTATLETAAAPVSPPTAEATLALPTAPATEPIATALPPPAPVTPGGLGSPVVLGLVAGAVLLLLLVWWIRRR